MTNKKLEECWSDHEYDGRKVLVEIGENWESVYNRSQWKERIVGGKTSKPHAKPLDNWWYLKSALAHVKFSDVNNKN